MRTRLGIWMVAIVSGCAGAPPPDFVDRLKQGCHDVSECRALHDAATQRLSQCSPDGLLHCEDARSDLAWASGLRARGDPEYSRELERVRWEEEAAAAAALARKIEALARETAEAARLADEEIERDRLVKRAEAQRKARAQLMVRCVRERADRATFKQEWDKRIAENVVYNAHRDAAIEWSKAHCARGTNPVIETREFVDRNGYVRLGRVVVDHEAITVCALSAPSSVLEFLELQREPGRFVGDWPLNILAPRIAGTFRETPRFDPDCAEFEYPPGSLTAPP